jgi:multisubunit Na+/H+ antiporter MnhG subunit
MSLKSYFDRELTTAIIFAIIGIIVGYASFVINNSTLSFVLMIIVGAVFYFLVKIAAKIKQDKRWWIGNAFIVYIFLWLITWIVYYNIGLR